MIRRALEKDITTIQDLAKKSWYATYSNILDQRQISYMLGLMYAQDVLEQHFRNPNFYYYLIESDGEPLGFMGYEKHYETDVTKLHRLYFLEEARGKGLGTSAIDFLKQETIKNGDSRIILTVNKNNRAKKFYESQGFGSYDEAVFDIGSGYVMDDYLMEYFL